MTMTLSEGYRQMRKVFNNHPSHPYPDYPYLSLRDEDDLDERIEQSQY